MKLFLYSTMFIDYLFHSYLYKCFNFYINFRYILLFNLYKIFKYFNSYCKKIFIFLFIIQRIFK